MVADGAVRERARPREVVRVSGAAPRPLVTSVAMCQGAYSSHIDKLVKIGSQSAGGAAMSASALRQCRWVHWQGPLTTPSPPDVAN